MIYFDNAATTPPLPFDYSTASWANPSSPHGMGIAAERQLTAARKTLAQLVNCQPNELLFTSGGTESNNLAVLGWVLGHGRTAARALGLLPLLCVEPWAHPSLLAPVQWAAAQGWAEAHIGPIASWPTAMPANRPTLSCLSQVHHETGDITHVSEVVAQLKSANPAVCIHVDGAQGFGKEAFAFAASGTDMYAASGHKCHGPTGVGLLAVRNGLRLSPLLHGGGQERTLRPGTENLMSIIHLAHAAQQLHPLLERHHAHAAALNAILRNLIHDLPDTYMNAQSPTPSPFILNLSFLGCKGEVLVHMLYEQGLCTSMGAACRSRTNTKTSLEAMGYDAAHAASALRLSFSHINTLDEAHAAKAKIIDCVTQLRKITGY